jgi:hypothetical protein
MDNPEKPRLKVTDRRQFTREGERRADAEEQETRSAPAAERPRPAQERAQSERAQDPLSIDFGRLVLSLARQTLMLLGEEPNPMDGRMEADLEGARETIDILMLLRAKTHGNLTPEESALLEQMIYELQMKYAHKTRR